MFSLHLLVDAVRDADKVTGQNPYLTPSQGERFQTDSIGWPSGKGKPTLCGPQPTLHLRFPSFFKHNWTVGCCAARGGIPIGKNTYVNRRLGNLTT